MGYHETNNPYFFETCDIDILELCFKPDSNTNAGISSSKRPVSQPYVFASGSTEGSIPTPSTTLCEQNVGDSNSQSQPDHSLVSNPFLEN